MDLSQYTSEELKQIAGLGQKNTADLSSYSNEELFKIAGIEPQPQTVIRQAPPQEPGLIEKALGLVGIEKPVRETMEPSQIAQAQIETEAKEKGLTQEQYKTEVYPEAKNVRRAEQFGKDIGSGALGTVEGIAGTVQWLTEGKVGKELADKAMLTRRELMPQDPTFIDDVMSGVGSMATFLIPGIGAARGASTLAKIAPKVAQWLGASTMAVTEAATEAGAVYRDKLRESKDIDEAEKAAQVTFWLNMPLLVVTDKLGYMGESGKMLRRKLVASAVETTQEGAQEIISTKAQGKDIKWKDVLRSGGVGAVVGGAFGGAGDIAGEQIEQPQTQEDETWEIQNLIVRAEKALGRKLTDAEVSKIVEAVRGQRAEATETEQEVKVEEPPKEDIVWENEEPIIAPEQEVSDDTQEEGRVLRGEREGEEPGRPVQVDERSSETTETGGVVQAPQIDLSEVPTEQLKKIAGVSRSGGEVLEEKKGTTPTPQPTPSKEVKQSFKEKIAATPEGHVDWKLTQKKERLEKKLTSLNKSAENQDRNAIPGTYVTGGSGVPKSRINKLNKQIDRRVKTATDIIETEKELKFVNAKIKSQQEGPKRQVVKEEAKTLLDKQFDTIEVGDLIDVGGNEPIKVLKKNKKTVVTENGVKWTASEIGKIIKKQPPVTPKPAPESTKEAEGIPGAGERSKPNTARIKEALGGKKYGVIESVDNTTADAVDWLISQGINRISVRNTLQRHKTEFAKLAQDRLKQLGWHQWKVDKSVWLKEPESSKETPEATEPVKEREPVQILRGDYIKFKTGGGVERYGDVSKVFDDGEISVIPDGAKNPIPIKPEQVISIEKGGRLRERQEYEERIKESKQTGREKMAAAREKRGKHKVGFHIRDTLVSAEKLNSLPKETVSEIMSIKDEFDKLGYVDFRTEMGPDQIRRLTENQKKKLDTARQKAVELELKVKGLLKTKEEKEAEKLKQASAEKEKELRQLFNRKRQIEDFLSKKLNSPRDNTTKREYAEILKNIEILQGKEQPLPPPPTGREKMAAAREKSKARKQWESEIRFFRSGKTKNAELPDGEKVILSQKATKTNFLDVSREFLDSIWDRKKDTYKPKPTPPKQKKAKAPKEGKKAPKRQEQGYTVTQIRPNTAPEGNDTSRHQITIQDDDTKGYLYGSLGEAKDAEQGEQFPLRDKSGAIIEWTGRKSTFPDWMSDNEYGKKETVTAIQKALEGKTLGIRQLKIVEDAIEFGRELEVAQQATDDYNKYIEDLNNDPEIQDAEIEQAERDGRESGIQKADEDFKEDSDSTEEELAKVFDKVAPSEKDLSKTKEEKPPPLVLEGEKMNMYEKAGMKGEKPQMNLFGETKDPSTIITRLKSEEGTSELINDLASAITRKIKNGGYDKQSFSIKPPKRLYRGQKEGKGTGIYSMGKGVYSTPDKSFAKKYGDVVEIDPIENFPRNPLVLRNVAGGAPQALTDWILQNSDFRNIREFNKSYPDPGQFIIEHGYDGIVAGDEIVKYKDTESGTSELINDLSYYGADLIRKGYDKFLTWQNQMRKTFGEVWDKIKGHLRDIWDYSKKIVGNQRGQVEAWHGSPHEVDKFKTEKIGTGEGAQAFGWGIYFSDLKSIGKHYAENLSRGNHVSVDGKPYIVSIDEAIANPVIDNILNRLVSGGIKNMREAIIVAEASTQSKPIVDKAVEFFKSGRVKVTGGAKNLYRVTLHKGKQPGEYEWLEWDKPVSDKAFMNLMNYGASEGGLFGRISNALGNYDRLNNKLNELASRPLREHEQHPEWADLHDKWANESIEEKNKIEKLLSSRMSKELARQNANKWTQDIAYGNMTGEKIYRAFETLGSSREASLFLLRAGIDGIKYPAGSLSGGTTQNATFKIDGKELSLVKETAWFLGEAARMHNGNTAGFRQAIKQRIYNIKHGLTEKKDLETFEKVLQAAKDGNLEVEVHSPHNYVVFDENAITIEERINLVDRIKSEEGTAGWINDLYDYGSRLIGQGYDNFLKFQRKMKQDFADVWDKIKGQIKAIWDTSKKLFTSERGEITIEGGKEKPKPTNMAKEIKEEPDPAFKAFLDGLHKEIKASKFKRTVDARKVERNPNDQEAVKKAYSNASIDSFTEEFTKKDGTIDGPKFFEKTGIHVADGAKAKDLSKWTRKLQIMQDFAKNYHEMKRLLEVHQKRIGGNNKMGIEDRKVTEPYFTLKGKRQKKVNKALLKGDRKRKKFSNETLEKKFGLDSGERKAYWAIRKVLDNKLDLIIKYNMETLFTKKRLAELEKTDTDIFETIVRAVKTRNNSLSQRKEKAQADKLLRGKLEKAGLNMLEIGAIMDKGGLADWTFSMRGYVPHKWKSEWRIKATTKSGKEYIFDVPTIKGKVLPTWQMRKEAAKKKAMQIAVDKLGTDIKSAVFIHSTQLPIDLFEDVGLARMKSVLQAGLESTLAEMKTGVTDTQQLEYIKTMKEKLESHVDELRLAKGWGQHLIGRKGVEGYREDLENVFAEYLTGFNSWYNKGIAAREFSDAIKEINPSKTPEMWKSSTEYVSDMLGESSEAAWFKKIAGLWFLAGDISAATLNMTQNWTHAVAKLRSIEPKTDKITAEREIARAMRDVIKEYVKAKQAGRGLYEQAGEHITEEEITALREAFERGLLDPQYFGEVTGLHGNKIHESYVNELHNKLYIMFTGSEAMNRMSTFLAAYRRIKRAGFEDAVSKAGEVTNAAHFIYGRGNRPEVVRKLGAIGNAMYTFMSYPAGNITFIKHNLEDFMKARTAHERKVASKVIGSNLAYIFAFGGINALPFGFLAKLILDIFRDPEDDFETLSRNVTNKYLGEDLGKFTGRLVNRGIPAAFGNDMSWRVEGTDVLGAPIGLQTAKGIQRKVWNYGIKPVARGEDYDTLLLAMPDMIANVYKAFSPEKQGTGLEGHPPIEYTGKEKAWKAMGFTPTREAETWKAQEIARNKRQRRLDKVTSFAERYLKSKRDRDEKAIKRLKMDVAKYNAKEKKKGGKGVRIPWRDIIQSARRRKKTREKGYEERLPKYMRKYQKAVGEDYGL